MEDLICSQILRLERWIYFKSLAADGSMTIWNLAEFMLKLFPAHNLMLSESGPRTSDAFIKAGSFGKTGFFQKKLIFTHWDKHHWLFNWYGVYSRFRFHFLPPMKQSIALCGIYVKRILGLAAISGNVGIGTTNPSTILSVVQSSATDPIADAWTVYSSRRWKTNIEPLTGALDKVQALRGVSFDWKADGKHDIGMIAEEAGKIIPEVVVYEENGIDAISLDYARITAVLVEAVKELQEQIEGLKQKVAELDVKKQAPNF